MIYIDKGELNKIVLTLTESVSISNPYFLFKFQWELDEDVTPIYWVGTDISIYTDRYNLFNFTEGTDAALRIGQYVYEVYESETSPVDETGLTKIEEGRMVVSGTATTIYD